MSPGEDDVCFSSGCVFGMETGRFFRDIFQVTAERHPADMMMGSGWEEMKRRITLRNMLPIMPDKKKNKNK